MRIALRSMVARVAFVVALPLAAASLTLAPAQSADAQQIPAGAKQPEEFPRANLTVGMFVIDAAVAANDPDRRQGLMYRSRLAPDEGMLFVYDESAAHCFWMKNTLIPLSIAFIRADGTITDIDEMDPETTSKHCAQNEGVYALEMSKRWFESKGIRPGVVIQGLPTAQ